MDIRNCFPSKYLEAKDFPQETPLAIAGIEINEVGQEKAARPVLKFAGQAKGMILNKTNAKTISNMYGFETDQWIGKPVTVYATDVEFQGEMKPALRIRTTPPTAATQIPQSAPPPAGNPSPAANDQQAPQQPTAAKLSQGTPPADIGAILRQQNEEIKW